MLNIIELFSPFRVPSRPLLLLLYFFHLLLSQNLHARIDIQC